MVQHEVSEGFVRRVGRNYYMILTVDGQRKQRKTGTNDLDKATDMLAEWRAQERVGVQADTRLRYEGIRDEYVLKSGRSPISNAHMRDIDKFFAGLRIAAITVDKLEEFREWRESQAHVLEYKQENIDKEIALRTMQALNGHRKSLTASEHAKIKADSERWIENGVKATTDRRLRILRAMMRFSMKRGKIERSDVPHFPILGEQVDNKKRGFFEESQFNQLLDKLPGYLHPYVKFLYATGMRSGQAAQLKWDMVNEKKTELHIPGELIKNKEDFSLPLVYADGRTIKGFEFRNNERRIGEQIFDVTDFRSQWRQACDALKLGIFNKETRSYRGMKPHDFRRTACRNMIANGIPESVAMAISGHKTNSIFKRYAITDKRMVQDAFEQMRKKK